MATFTLLVVPDGKAMLVSSERIPDTVHQSIREAVDGWLRGDWPVLVLQDCDVVQVAAVDLDLAEPVAV